MMVCEMMSDRTKSTSKCYESEVGGAPVSSSCISKNPATHKKMIKVCERHSPFWNWFYPMIMIWNVGVKKITWRARKCNWETKSCLKMDSIPAKKYSILKTTKGTYINLPITRLLKLYLSESRYLQKIPIIR